MISVAIKCSTSVSYSVAYAGVQSGGEIPEGAIQFEGTGEYVKFEGSDEYITFEPSTPPIPQGALMFENTNEYIFFEGQSEPDYLTF